MSTIRLLIKPTLFTVGVCGTCFCGATIMNYENRKRSPVHITQDWVALQRMRANMSEKELAFRQKIHAWKNSLSVGEKIACGTIFINFIVLCAWRAKRLQPMMTKYFMSQISTSKIYVSPMILSCFSHTMPLHFAFNMYALYSFAPYATSLLGPEQLVGLFLSAGAVSSLASIAHRLVTKRSIPSLGASGALLGVIAYICVARPESNLLLFFIPITAGNAIKLLMVVDSVGLLAKWRYFDHAAHLGGSLFGFWYATYGQKLFYYNRTTVIDNWLKIKRRFD